MSRSTSQVKTPVPPWENSSTTTVVLEFSHGGTGSIAVVDLLFVAVKGQILHDAYTLEGCLNRLLMLWRKGQLAATISKIDVAPELSNQYLHE